jgi:small subunit ribosomal protein S18
MTTESEPSIEAAPAVAPVEAPAPAPIPRITPAPESGDRLPHMIERTRRRGRRRRAPVFTPQEVKTIDYKDVDRLKKLISDRGRIEPRRKTGLTAKDQRKIAREIKRARQVALLPYTAEHMRQTSRFRMVTRMAQRAMRAELDDAPPSEPAEGGAALEEPVNESAQVAAQVAPESVTEVATDAAPEVAAEAAPEVAAEAAPKVSPEAVAEVAAANEESSV